MVPACQCVRPCRRLCRRATLEGEVVVTMADKRIVVGVDGSPSSMKALRWAIRQAELTGAEVEAVTAWSYPSGYGWDTSGDGAIDFEGNAGKLLFEALAEVSGIAPDVVVEPVVAYGHAADVLVRAAEGADLLVVGSRGHGGFAGMLVGSVSQHCVQHARCPVLVLHDGR
jgi:nucleotide-binding universal stress UspA family protein